MMLAGVTGTVIDHCFPRTVAAFSAASVRNITHFHPDMLALLRPFFSMLLIPRASAFWPVRVPSNPNSDRLLTDVTEHA